MKNLNSILSLILVLFLSNCESEDNNVNGNFTPSINCKTCTVGITEFTWADGLSTSEIADMDEMYELLGYADTQAYYDAIADASTVEGVEYCGDELETMKATPATVVPGQYTYGVTCVK